MTWQCMRLTAAQWAVVDLSVQKGFRLVAADAHHCQCNGGVNGKENNPACFKTDPKKGLS